MQDTGPDPRVGKPTSENCLTLNVWAPPRGQRGDKRPVMVWIHGGGFVNGSGDIYHSRSLVVKGHIIVVTINYRLGALGFLAHPSLGPPGGVGNYGLADQQAALRWVRDNISAFGGDPQRVTIAGESAGGMSVCDHLVAPGSVGLFRAAIIQSAPCQAQADLATGQRTSVDYAAQAGCRNPVTTAMCLRALPAARLDRPPWYYFIGDSNALSGPVTGTTALPAGPVAAFAAGQAARVPVLMGVNHDEFTMFAAFRHRRFGRAVESAEYPHMLADIFGADGAAVMTHYSPDHFGGDVSLAYSAAVTDAAFACATERLADSLSRNAPVYAYEFDDPHAPAPEPLRDAPFPVGASHSLELAYLFNVGGLAPFDPAQQLLSDQMISYWANFVIDGVPKAAGLPELAGSNRRRRAGCLDVAATRRQRGHHRFRDGTSMPVLGVTERPIVSTPEPDAFAEQWVAAWNRRDAEAVLAHFHDDVVFTSPIAAEIAPDTAGVVHGKAALREYWTAALALVPDLHFDVVGVYQGESVLVINYRNQRGALVNEVLEFDGARVRRGHGTYLNAAE